ncbi:hypothetical protein [Helicobacter zhangjianzhongii]|uniref:Uncharacterized protein n=1 Tax=Helicobacter zhangjianzhongii TaxID=2974574 RepID=A0ACC6FTI1_9HELI|nr:MULTISPECIES: hypothetical protein [unclassified Helicobacter]MDL0080325.1 hypothetical protein [Helicobacter sp. CPD2-1]MDL0082528.1 hypothetical protein [Helicobacter sp. XJK30-2]
MDSRAARKAAMSKVDSRLESTFKTTQTLQEQTKDSRSSSCF